MTATAPDTGRTATRSVLRRRDYRFLLLSFGTSRAGDFLYLVALVVYVYDQTQSPAWVAAATLGRFVPNVALSPFAGVLADRYERRTIMAVSDALQFAAMAGLTAVAALSGPAVLVVVLAAVSASAATLYQAAASSMVASTVPEDELAAANSLLSTVDTVAFVAGPAAGGLLLLLGDATVAFGINAATFVASAAFLAAIRTRSRPTDVADRAGAVRELREGIGVFLGNRSIAVLVLCLVAGTVVYGVELVALVLVSTELLGTGAEGLGWLLAASGAGGVVGAAVSSRLATLVRPRIVIAVLVLLTGLPLAALAAVRMPLLAYLILIVEGAAIVALDILIETAMQRGIPRDVLGRVSGLTISLASVGTVTGTLLAPVLIDAIGLGATLVLVGVVPVTLAAASLSLLSTFDSDVSQAGRALAPRVLLLEQLRLFEGADRPALERLAGAASEERVPAGTVLLRQGDPADDLLVLVEGALAVDHTVDGVRTRVNDMTAPDYVGEIGLVRRVDRTATVTAATDTVVWRVPGALFLDTVNAGSAFLTGGISTRLARTPTASR